MSVIARSSSIVVARPKGMATKPGKRTPTVAEAAWMDAITTIGCIACLLDDRPNTPGVVHHILSGGQRMGHMFSICLCQPGHHMDGQQKGLISRHPFKAQFERRYGSERALLAHSQYLVKGTP